MRARFAAAAALLGATLATGCARDASESRRVLLAATYTVEDSGLLQHLIDGFHEAHPEYRLLVAVSGTGEALELGRRGDIDVVLSHSPEQERDFMEDGFGLTRRDVMESDFVLLGPPGDPAGIGGTRDIGIAFRRLAGAQAPFISRGDESGTHTRELAIWDELGFTPAGEWYVEAGVGTADALRMASERRAYILADRPTFLTLSQTLQLEIVSERDPRLLNPYSVIVVRGAGNQDGGRAFVDWITGPDAQRLIGAHGTNEFGQSLFAPVRASR